MVVSSDPAWLQGDFSALVAIFDRVGLRKNVNKTVSMACHPCRAGTGTRTTEGYRRRLTGVGEHSRRGRERVACRECGAEITAGSMSSHMMTRHGKAATRRHLWAPQTSGSPGCTKWIFPRRTAGNSARWRDARGFQRHGPRRQAVTTKLLAPPHHGGKGRRLL